MKKKLASKSAFFNPRVLIGFAICAIGLLMALLAFGLYPGGHALARQNQLVLGAPFTHATEVAAIEDTDGAILPDAEQPITPPLPEVPGAVFVVTTTLDTQDVTPGDGICADAGALCSLRAAITESNALAGADTITLPAGNYTATLVAANEDLNAGGDFDIRSALTINGAGSFTTAIQANAAPNTATERVIHITTGSTAVDINNVTIRNGNATGATSGGGMSVAVTSTVNLTNVLITNNRGLFPANNFFGGGMIVSGVGANVTLTGCTVSNNSAIGGSAATNGFAGGIYNQQATVSLINSTVTGNISSSFHGGIRSLSSTAAVATTNITNSTISNNTAQGLNGAAAAGEGGGVTNIAASTFACTTNITGSTISGNTALVGGIPGVGTAAGGIENFSVSTGAGLVNVTNSTVSGNSADVAGGIYSDGAAATMNLKYSTINGNSTNGATSTGGGVLQDVTVGGVTNLKSSIIANNTATTGPDISGTITSQNYNHVESTAGGVFVGAGNDVTGSDPALGALAANGGPTFTHLPAGGSPVVDTIPGGTNECGTTVAVDQRAIARPQGGGCDKGSVEVELVGTPTPTPTPSGTPTATATSTATSTATATIPIPTPTPSPTVTPPATECDLFEQFFDINTLVPAGWSMTNLSTIPGAVAFFQGNSAVFPAQLGAPNSYIAANFNADAGPATDTISDWLLTPPVTLQNGGVLSFWTRTVTTVQFPDRLQVRFSRNGTSQNVGVGPTGVGDFGTLAEGGTGQGDLLLDINPTYLLTGVGSYPNVWTNFTITLNSTQIPTPGKGRLAFRYFVENGGPNGVNSDYIGIDTVSYGCTGIIPTPTPQVTATPTPTPTVTPSPGITPTPTPCITLYSQIDSPGLNAVNSQNFETANDAFDNQGADDFVVPVGPNWTIQQVAVSGVYFNGVPLPGGPAASFHVTFHNNAVTIPGTIVGVAGADQTNLGYTQVGSTFTIYLNTFVTLVPGTYWVSVRVNMDFGAPTAGQWGWTNRTITTGSPAAWQNPGGGFVTACNAWGARGALCGIAPTEPDQIFQLLGSSSACPSPTPSTFDISGTVTYCAGATPQPVAGVTMTLTGGPGGSTVTAANGTYSFTGLPAGVNYTVTPSRAARPIGTSGINGVDVIAIQKHFLQIPTLLLACHLLAADVTPPLMGNPNGVDVIAVSKFFLQLPGTASTGFYGFSPANRTYTPLNANQTGQDFEARILGDVVGGFVNPPRPGGGGDSDAPASEDSSRELPSTVAAIALPDVGADQANDFIAAVRTSAVDANHKLVGFQGDFTFDERVVTFASQPVSSAGLTGNNWNVSGNVLAGTGPIRTLRVVAFSNDFTPLKGEGTLFNLNMIQVGQGAQSTPLIWAAPPDQFMFIDADLNTQKAGNAAPGSVTSRPSQR